MKLDTLIVSTNASSTSTSSVADADRHYNSSSMPIYQTATFLLPPPSATSVDAPYDYTRSGNPTRTHLETHLMKVIGGGVDGVFCTGSGMSALDVILRLLKSGDEVITGDDLYGGTNRLLSHLSGHAGIVVHHVSTCSPTLSALKEKLSEKTAMILLETPSNPLLKTSDIRAISTLAHSFKPEILVVVDNTMLSPFLQRGLLGGGDEGGMGVDLEYHSATKYLCGHHDLMGGVIATSTPSLSQRVGWLVNAMGVALSPFDAFLLLRGLKTLALRLTAQQTSALSLAQSLESTFPQFHVFYPGLKNYDERQGEVHRSQARGSGGVFSFSTGSIELSKRILQRISLFSISVSFGCVNSLISMPCLMSHASIPASIRKERGLCEDLVRISVGIEDPTDLWDDLKGAIERSLVEE